MRVLVIDDQVEFFDSIVRTLKTNGFKAKHSLSLEAGTQLAASEVFDLAFVDLQMPPGNWGGLEVIKELRRQDSSLPIVVLSGKGSLAECVQAVRLGARDYIQKENFETDFQQRIIPFYKNPYAIVFFPSILGYLYRVFGEEQNQYLKARKLIDVYEFTVRLLSLCTLADVAERSNKSKEDMLVAADLERPSLGAYVNFLFQQISKPGNGPFTRMIGESDVANQRKLFDRLTKCRNESFGHTVTISQSEASKLILEISSVVTTILNSVSFLRRLDFVLVDSLTYDGRGFGVDGKLLRGDNLLHASVRLQSKMPVRKGDICIFFANEYLIDVDPYLTIQPSGSGEQSLYGVYDKFQDKKLHYLTVPRHL